MSVRSEWRGVTKKLQGLLQRQSPADEVIVVSGLPRSGTSLMMKMLEAGGVPPLTDGLRVADRDNPRGYYELESAKKLSSGDTTWLAEAPGKAVKVIATLLTYLPDAYQYRVVFMRRRMPEILASQRTMLVNRGEDPDAVSDDEMTRLFSGHLERILPWLAEQPNFSVLEVDYNDLLARPDLDRLEQIREFVGLDLDVESMRSVIEPDLYRQREPH